MVRVIMLASPVPGEVAEAMAMDAARASDRDSSVDGEEDVAALPALVGTDDEDDEASHVGASPVTDPGGAGRRDPHRHGRAWRAGSASRRGCEPRVFRREVIPLLAAAGDFAGLEEELRQLPQFSGRDGLLLLPPLVREIEAAVRRRWSDADAKLQGLGFRPGGRAQGSTEQFRFLVVNPGGHGITKPSGSLNVDKVHALLAGCHAQRAHLVALSAPNKGPRVALPADVPVAWAGSESSNFDGAAAMIPLQSLPSVEVVDDLSEDRILWLRITHPARGADVVPQTYICVAHLPPLGSERYPGERLELIEQVRRGSLRLQEDRGVAGPCARKGVYSELWVGDWNVRLWCLRVNRREPAGGSGEGPCQRRLGGCRTRAWDGLPQSRRPSYPV